VQQNRVTVSQGDVEDRVAAHGARGQLDVQNLSGAKETLQPLVDLIIPALADQVDLDHAGGVIELVGDAILPATEGLPLQSNGSRLTAAPTPAPNRSAALPSRTAISTVPPLLTSASNAPGAASA